MRGCREREAGWDDSFVSPGQQLSAQEKVQVCVKKRHPTSVRMAGGRKHPSTCLSVGSRFVTFN